MSSSPSSLSHHRCPARGRRGLCLAAVVAALACALPAAAQPEATTLAIRARADLAGGVGPILHVRVDGVVAGVIEVRSAVEADYQVATTRLAPGSRVELVYTNDARVGAEDRNVYVTHLRAGTTTLWPSAPGVLFDRGSGAAAFDGQDVIPGQSALYWGGALRLTWPEPRAEVKADAAGFAASRFLQQASFGPTLGELERLRRMGFEAWIDEQIALPFVPVYVDAVQARFDAGPAYRPGGAAYSPFVVTETFWHGVATRPDQLRQRVAFALQQIFVVSLRDGNLWNHARPYAQLLDTLARHAFGNYRQLLEDVALSPAMGIYLSHLHNRREDAAGGRLPDENFARELMQLFSIGLHELGPDGSARPGPDGRPIETYGNDDVMALAKVFTGWSWGFEPSRRSERAFLEGSPDYATTGAARVDLRPMAFYPAFHSPAEKRLFAGKPHAVTIPAGTPGPDALRIALDALFRHPNVGPFVGRQLIQRLVTSNPSPGYVRRVAAAFDDNGHGVRGDLGAVVRAVLLDPEARAAPAAQAGKLREPVLRVAHWMRAFGARSASGRFRMAHEGAGVLQQPQHAPSVFNFYRPGYVPPGTELAAADLAAPEFQIADESSVAAWVDLAQAMTERGLGWNDDAPDVVASLAAEAALAGSDPEALVDRLDLLLYAGQMSGALRSDLLEAMHAVVGSAATRDHERARLATFIALASPEYLIER